MNYGTSHRENYLEISRKLERMSNLTSQSNYKEFWDHSKEVLEMFKTLKPLESGDRENLWKQYISLKERVKKGMEANAQKLEEAINQLAATTMPGGVHPFLKGFHPFPPQAYDHSKFWPKAKEIAQTFKAVSVFKGDRERLWTKYNNLCENAKRQREESTAKSAANRKIIEELINLARLTAQSPSGKEEFERARNYQNQALEKMKELHLLKNDREACWQYRSKVNEEIFFRRQQIQESNFRRAMQRARECLSMANALDPYDTLKEIKSVHEELKGLYMHRDHWTEVGSTLDYAWETASSRIGKAKEEKQRKHADWMDRMGDNISRWEGNMERAKDAISRIESNISNLEDMAANAKTSSFADKVQGWIDENNSKIDDIKSNIREWESKIADAKSKMRE